MAATVDLQALRKAFGNRLQTGVSLKRFTAARLGGAAAVLIEAVSAEELADIASRLWQMEMPFILLGSGSNVLVSDAGVKQVVVLNRAKKVKFNTEAKPPNVWVESGANLGSVARRVAALGLSGLEWAAGIPGTVGGAIYGNAGAHDGDMAGNLLMAEILQLNQGVGSSKQEILQEKWQAEYFEYEYRNSKIKRQPGKVVVLSAELRLDASTPQVVQAKMKEFENRRHASQPSGASLGSIFKNPVGDHAGRLIEAAGLKGTAIGRVEISRKHANFFISHDNACASDYAELIRLAQETVYDKFGVKLELEIEQIGDWTNNQDS